LLDTTATLTDETLDLHDRLIGTFFSKVRSKYDREFAADGRALNDKVRLYAKIGSALIAAKEAKTDPFAAIEEIIPWKEFTDSVSAYREDSPENRTFNRSCHVGDGRGGDLLQSRAGYKQVSAAWTSRNTARGLSTPECQNL
jgi:hypothetical protein